jgi:hypothetical protein
MSIATDIRTACRQASDRRTSDRRVLARRTFGVQPAALARSGKKVLGANRAAIRQPCSQTFDRMANIRVRSCAQHPGDLAATPPQPQKS